MADKITTPEFRVSFPNVMRPRAMNEGDTPKYGITMLFPKGADLSALKAAAEDAVKEKWGDKPPKGLRSPFRDQGEREYEGYEEGAIFINCTTTQRPGLVDHNVQPIIDEADFYPGCYAIATIRAFAYEKKGNKGVSFGLQNIQKTRDGDSLGGRSKAEDDFEPVDADPNASSDSVFD